MTTLVLKAADLATGQLDTAKDLVAMLRDGGPWALLALALIAIAWLARLYVQARDDRDKAVSDLNDKLTGLLKDMVVSAEQQKASNEKVVGLLNRIESNEKVVDVLDRIERRLENVSPRQG